jgi:hypothetical protein
VAGVVAVRDAAGLLLASVIVMTFCMEILLLPLRPSTLHSISAFTPSLAKLIIE